MDCATRSKADSCSRVTLTLGRAKENTMSSAAPNRHTLSARKWVICCTVRASHLPP
jgi:hypothetical protein